MADTLVAIELNDAMLVVADGAGLQAWRDPTAERPWSPFQSPATVVTAHLRVLWQQFGHREAARVLLAVAPWWEGQEQPAFAALADDLGMQVIGAADAAVAATRHEYPGRELLHLDIGLQALTVTRIRQSGDATLGDREQFPELGVEALLKVTTDAIARRFVDCSRFDPLHDGEAEQALFDRLPDWLGRLARDQDATLELTTRSGRFTATVSAADFKARIANACGPLLQALRARVAGRGPHALQVHHRLAAFPGVLETLLRLPDTVVHVLEPGAAALGLLARARAVMAHEAAGRRPWQPVTALPFDLPAAPLVGDARGRTTHRQPKPTHVLLGHRLFRLDGSAFHIGAELAAGEAGVAVEPGVRGVSRHHCTVRIEQGELMLFDHSRFGTWLNGHRLQGAAVLEAGDVVTVGSPPVEFRLVSEAGDRGSSSGP